MGVPFNIGLNSTGKAGEEQYVVSVYDLSATGCQTGLWVTHPVAANTRGKILAAVLDIISRAHACTTFAEAQQRIGELWIQNGLHKPSTA